MTVRILGTPGARGTQAVLLAPMITIVLTYIPQQLAQQLQSPATAKSLANRILIHACLSKCFVTLPKPLRVVSIVIQTQIAQLYTDLEVNALPRTVYLALQILIASPRGIYLLQSAKVILVRVVLAILSVQQGSIVKMMDLV